MARVVLILASLLALAACSGRKAADADAPPPKQKTVFDDQLKALDKAKAVEKQLQEEKEKHDQEIDAQGG